MQILSLLKLRTAQYRKAKLKVKGCNSSTCAIGLAGQEITSKVRNWSVGWNKVDNAPDKCTVQ